MVILCESFPVPIVKRLILHQSQRRRERQLIKRFRDVFFHTLAIKTEKLSFMSCHIQLDAQFGRVITIMCIFVFHNVGILSQLLGNGMLFKCYN